MSVIRVECPECEETMELEVDVTPYIEAKTYGPPENCYPAEGGEVELTDGAIPKACPECKTVWTPEQSQIVEERADRAMEDFEPDDYDSGPEPEYYEDR